MASRRKEIKKSRAKINKIKRKEKIDKTKSWIFEKINKIYTLLLDWGKKDSNY